ncbi:MAG: hypothetical protein AMXMBFR57_34180 [Acidimicrobiia bacterium]
MKHRWLLRMYPHAWRERYGEEFSALLEQSPTSWRTFADVVIAAGAEWSRSAWRDRRSLAHTARGIVGYYCAINLIFAVITSIPDLEFAARGPRAFHWDGLLLSAAIQARMAIFTAAFVFGLGFVVLGPYPTRVRRWVLDWMRGLALFPVVISVSLAARYGIGPDAATVGAYFGETNLHSTITFLFVADWAIATVRGWLDEHPPASH